MVRPYLALFMFELGLNPFQVGCVKGLEPFVILTCSPGWGSIADKHSIRKSLLIICAIGSAVFLPLQLFSPPVNFSATSEFSLANSSDRLKFTTEDAGDSSIEDEVSFDVRHQLFPAASQLTFWTVASLAFLDNIFIAGFLPLLDALTMELVKLYHDTSYGGQRWPGAFAVVVFSPVVGILTDWYQNSGISLGDFYFLQSRYLPSFALFSLLIFISVIPVIMMKDAPSNQSPPSFSRELLIIFRDLHVILSFVLFIVAGACKGIVGTFLFLFLDELNASKLLMSLSLVVTCLIETPCLIYSGKVINKLGYEAVFCLGLFAYAVRMFCYSILVNPVYVLPIEMLHGICYGLLWPSCTEYANHIAPQGMSSTLQALAHAAKAGVGEYKVYTGIP